MFSSSSAEVEVVMKSLSLDQLRDFAATLPVVELVNLACPDT